MTIIDERCLRAPAEPLRPYVAWYAGYRQRGLAPRPPSRRPAEEFLAFAVSVLANGRIVSSDGGCSASTGHTGQHKELHMSKAAYE